MQINCILLVDQRLEVSQLDHACQNLCKLVPIDPIIVQEESVDHAEIEHLASRCETFYIAFAQEIVLQAQRLLPDLVKNG